MNSKDIIAEKIGATPFGLSLRANFSWTFAGNVVYAACQWGMVVLLTKLGSPEMVGQFALGLAITAPIILLANLQLRNIQATDARQEFQFGHYFGLRLLTTALALLVIFGIVLFSGYRWETALVILAIGLAKSFEAISDVFYGLLQQQERMDWISKSLMLKGPLSLVALGVGIYLFGTLIWGVVGMMFAWAIVLITYDYRSGMKISRLVLAKDGVDVYLGGQTAQILPKWEWLTLGRLAYLALPLGIMTMLISLNSNVPRYFIEHYWGESELGIFAAIAYLMVVGRTIVSALGQSATPRLSQYYAAGNFNAFTRLLFKLIGFGIFVGGAIVLLASVVGQEILTYIYQPEYARQDVFVLLMVAAAFNYIAFFLNYGMIAARYLLIQIPLFTIVLGIIILVGFWSIPLIGLRGAAVALISGGVVQVLLSILVIRRALNVNLMAECTYDK
jgi:O-antigen/teichoic acid export membrane protein